MDRVYCVYKHTNKINGKVYIGITSQSPRKRWDCGRGYQKNDHFWRAIQKYGWDSFDHEIIVEGLSPDEAFSEEQRLIREYGSQNYENGYNLSSGGEGGATGVGGENHPMHGKRHSDETRAKISAVKKGVPYSPERYATFLENLDREVLRERAMRTIVGYNRGKHWDAETRRRISESNRGKKRSEETARRISEAHKKPVLQFARNGDFIREWDSARSASEALSIQAAHISKVCKKKYKTAGGYVWQYKCDFKEE